MNVENRTIFENDNLQVLRRLDADSIDLIYLDPPFNSNRTFAAPISSEAAGTGFKDSWTLDDLDSASHGELTEKEPQLYHIISAAEFSHGKAMKAYLIMMSIRMLEMHRILKPTGTLYLHCDDKASHYLKMVMDSIFGKDNFRNEIIWQRAVTSKGNLKKGLARDSDTIFRYSKTNVFIWNPEAVTIPYDMANLDEKTKKQYCYVEPDTGRLVSYTSLTAQTQDPDSHLTYEIMGVTRTWRWTKKRMRKEIKAGRIVQIRPGNVPRYKRYLDEQKGKTLNNIWIDIPNLTAKNKERVGYPTQKPLALLARIIRASSNPGDMVLDPFCGCATTCVAAEGLQRRWIGIDLSPKSYELVQVRLEQYGILKQIHHRTRNP
ncbi:MAG: DNA methyltransferase [Candidatus Poribacteria bacterium]|nr:DNA methyltransferase [Candidatus Poribacteria bacterium]